MDIENQNHKGKYYQMMEKQIKIWAVHNMTSEMNEASKDSAEAVSYMISH